MVEKLGTLLLWATALYHLVMGSFSLLSVQMTRKSVGVLYGAQYQNGIDPKLEFIWKPLGAFALVVSAFCFRGIFVHDPEYRSFVLRIMAALFLLRAYIRLQYRDLLYRAHQISTGRNSINIVLNTLFASLALLASGVASR